MANSYAAVDYSVWPRRPYCELYKTAVQPSYSISFELDVTRFRARTAAAGASFTLSFIHAVTACANELENFRFRFLDGRVVCYDRIDAAFTWLAPGEELFKFLTVPAGGSAEEFIRAANAAAQRQTVPIPGLPANDAFIFSALPWITFTHVSHTDFGRPEQAQPMFDWGKYRLREGRLWMPFSVQVHHAFVDGVHIGMLADRLAQRLDGV